MKYKGGYKKLFEYIFEGEPSYLDFTDKELSAIEEKLGIKLPETYIKLMKIHNGGELAYNALKISGEEVIIDELEGIALNEGIGNSNYLVQEWELDKGFVVFAGDGNYWLVFDYRNYTGNDPAVFYIEEDGGKPKKVAKNFEGFVKKLQEPEEIDFDDEDDEDDHIYTKEEFEKLMEKGKSYVDIANCFDQFAEEKGDLEWFIKMALRGIDKKHLDTLSWTIGESVLVKLKNDAGEDWPTEQLNELAEKLINFKDTDGLLDSYTAKFGRKLQNKLNRKK